jgi:telomerase protein component 1
VREEEPEIGDLPLPSEEVAFEICTPEEIRGMKQELLNTVAAALINEPRPSATNPTFVRITTLCKKIAFYDPEFVLKLALYVRDDLNIRFVFLLSLSFDVPF